MRSRTKAVARLHIRDRPTTLRGSADRAIGYARICQLSDPGSRQGADDVGHAQILEALIADDEPGALTRMAHHLTRTALPLLTDCAPQFVPVAVPHAVALIDSPRGPRCG